ncbi:hypothetical protein R1sor_014872 [Riccia sorocarpa]|uniref:Reverse transcriptase/retrotransposon-derived protein RNase H-like domain-containing protein n=1 Tax=Riccia sorocarpa TaxID=122646 RepID=A0ABD3HAL5_9MARC
MMDGMNKVLHKFIPKKTMPFLDDIPIKGCVEEKKDETLDGEGCRKFVADHIVDCEQILSRLEEVGLTLSGTKSTFGVKQVVIVGHYVGGLGGNLILIRFTWEEHHTDVVQKLKETLSSPPILHRICYEDNKLVVLTVDTSPIAIGWAVGQDDGDGNRYAIRFGAKVLNNRQRDYAQVK